MVKCSVCGAPVEGDRCEYCGFQVEDKRWRRRQAHSKKSNEEQEPYQYARQEQGVEYENPYAYRQEQADASHFYAEQKNYPEWVERMPGFMKRMAKKYGWLYGVYIAISGGFLALVGIIIRSVARQTIAQKFFGFDFNNTYFYFPAGTDPFVDAAKSTWTLYSSISRFAIICGLLIMIGGIILASKLKKWGRR